jgi:hypothetical protein
VLAPQSLRERFAGDALRLTGLYHPRDGV